MTGAAISQRHLTAGGQTSRQPNRCARSSSSHSRRPSPVAESKHPAPRDRADRHPWRYPRARKVQPRIPCPRHRSRADQAKLVKSP
jgi:hypothetical protein